MPRETRKEVKKRLGVDTPEPVPIKQLAEELDREPTFTVRHLRCPVCGLVVSLEEKETPVKHVIIGIEGGPYEVVGRWQNFGGGSLPSHTGNIRERPGLMYWSDDEEITDDERQLLINKLQAALEMLGG